MSFVEPMSSLLNSDAPIEHQSEVYLRVRTGLLIRLAARDELGGRDRDEPDQVTWRRVDSRTINRDLFVEKLQKIFEEYHQKRRAALDRIDMAMPEENYSLHCSVGAPKPSVSSRRVASSTINRELFEENLQKSSSDHIKRAPTLYWPRKWIPKSICKPSEPENYSFHCSDRALKASVRKHFNIRKWLTVNSNIGDSKIAVNRKKSGSWIIATAAPHHATGNRNLLSGFIMEHDDQFVHAVNQVPMKVLACGAVVTHALILPDVWFVPGLTENLVSVSQLAELDHTIGFGRGECCIRSARDAKMVGKGRLQKGGHYVLDYLNVALAI